MMTTRRLLIGGLLVCILLLPQAARGSMPLYERMKRAVEQEIARTEVDQTVVPFLRLVFEEEWRLNDDDIRGILQGEGPRICATPDPEKPIDNLLSCFEIESRVQHLSHYETRIRSLGRTLQSTATSYELPISDLPGRSLKFAADLRAILNIWSAGTGSVKTTIDAPLIRTITGDPAIFQSLLTDIGEELETMDEEQRVAAVWRYQYGLRLIRNERAPRFPAPPIPPNSGPGTERQYQYKRWDDLEEVLQALWTEIQDDTFDPPLTSQETVYYTFTKELRDQSLPDNIIVWARLDGDAENGLPFSDVGLQWEVPIDPVLPSLKKDDDDDDIPILGGDYPPEPVTYVSTEATPVDGHGLCTSPVAARGYLCRPFEVIPSEERCPVDENATQEPNTIGLIHCTNTGSLRFTAAGPDVCREIGWKDSLPFDPNNNCRIALRCSDDCTPGAYAGGFTSLKNAQGVIEICANNQTEYANTYFLFHELAHAYAACNMPVGYDPMSDKTPEEQNAICCQREGEAYRAQCEMMEHDGVFHTPEGAPIRSSDGVTVNAQTCTEVAMNSACGEQQGFNGCFTSRTYSEEFKQLLVQTVRRNPKNVPASCEDAIDTDKMDERVRQLKEAAEVRDDVCKPGQVNVYKNRIGNNACYIGQCVEMSVELHRIAAGRTPATVQDQMAPWDDPQSATPLGNILLNPPTTQTQLPSYQPQRFMRELEIALCQLQGLPPRTPPILCAIDARRQLEFTRGFGIQTTEGLSQQMSEQSLSAEDLLDLAQGVGARLGTSLYGNYLRESNRSFAGILSMATELLEELKKVDFPTQMCPISPGMPPPVNQN